MHNGDLRPDDSLRFKKVMNLLYATCAIVFLAGINRKFAPSCFYKSCLDVLHLSDLNVVFLLTPAAIICLYFIFKLYEGTSSHFCVILFIMGVYFSGVGFGMHEPTNRMYSIYCRHNNEISAAVKRSILFFDDDLSHWVFFVGFILITISGAFAEIRNPFKNKLSFKQLIPILIISLITAWVIYANMVKENTGLDLLVLVIAIVIVLIDQYRHKPLSFLQIPISTTMYIAYGVGTLATLFHWGVKAACQ